MIIKPYFGELKLGMKVIFGSKGEYTGYVSDIISDTDIRLNADDNDYCVNWRILRRPDDNAWGANYDKGYLAVIIDKIDNWKKYLAGE